MSDTTTQRLARIEAKLDAILEALSEEDEEDQQTTLDGQAQAPRSEGRGTL